MLIFVKCNPGGSRTSETSWILPDHSPYLILSYLGIFDRAALSPMMTTSLWNWRIDAGTSGVTGPKNAFATMSAFASPFTTRRIFFARMIVPMPIVYACLGTSSADAKNLLFASIVLSVRSTQCVFCAKEASGSLNPICPL